MPVSVNTMPLHAKNAFIRKVVFGKIGAFETNTFIDNIIPVIYHLEVVLEIRTTKAYFSYFIFYKEKNLFLTSDIAFGF